MTFMCIIWQKFKVVLEVNLASLHNIWHSSEIAQKLYINIGHYRIYSNWCFRGTVQSKISLVIKPDSLIAKLDAHFQLKRHS